VSWREATWVELDERLRAHPERFVYVGATDVRSKGRPYVDDEGTVAIVTPPGAVYPGVPTAIQVYPRSHGNAARPTDVCVDALVDGTTPFVVYGPEDAIVRSRRAPSGVEQQRRFVLDRLAPRPATPDVRLAGPDDEAEILRLYVGSSGLRFHPGALRWGPFVTARSGGPILGAFGTHVDARPFAWLLGHLWVAREARGQGVGLALVTGLTGEIATFGGRVFVDIDPLNKASTTLLQTAGFKPTALMLKTAMWS
jgi:GNAT superfamily N-acetyltransferase